MVIIPGLPVFQTDLFVPRYRPLKSGPWEVRPAGPWIATGSAQPW